MDTMKITNLTPDEVDTIYEHISLIKAIAMTFVSADDDLSPEIIVPLSAEILSRIDNIKDVLDRAEG